MEKVLFTCVGTSDPVRGEHDGPMLHILRHYRPDAVYVFMTPEIKRLDRKDNRFKKLQEFMCSAWGGYQPKWREYHCDIDNAYDIDMLDKPMHEAIEAAASEFSGAEFLINLTSGTPQMQMILSQLAMNIRYRARGIQVINFEGGAGSSLRTNDKSYDIDLELECNEDEEPGANRRLFEPKMYPIHRKNAQQRIIALLEQRDFHAVAQMINTLPPELGNLIRHLDARSRLDTLEAERYGKLVRHIDIKLYSYKSSDRAEYKKVSEYYLLMRNLVSAGHYTEFLLHMEPLTLNLQLALLKLLLQQYKVKTEDFILNRNGRQVFDPDLLSKSFPALYEHYMNKLTARGWAAEQRDISTYLCDELLTFFSPLPQCAADLFMHYNKLKDLRNRQAHELCVCTAAEIEIACGCKPNALLPEIEKTICTCFEACDPSIFTVYDRCVTYIEKAL